MQTGIVTLVGAGPGDPGLLTLKGARALALADVVVYDRLVSPAVLARIPAHAERIDVGKESGSHLVPQQRIEEILCEKALEGKRVVRLKGGDPFLFGRGGEELAYLAAHGISFAEVPGVPSAIAAPAYAGIPATLRGASRSLHVFTGHAKNGEPPTLPYDAIAGLGGTLVFLMGVSTLESICTGLLSAGLAPGTPAAVVENGTLPTQRRVSAPLSGMAEAARTAQIHPPAILVVGEVCAQAETLDWFTRLPLFGCRVALTMPDDSAAPLAKRLRALGAQPMAFPCIRTDMIVPNEPLRAAIARLQSYQWVVFTSRRGVDAFFHALHEAGFDSRKLFGVKIAAIAAYTAAHLAQYGVRADLVPEQAGGGQLAEAVLQAASPGKHVLLCRSAQGAPELPMFLCMGGLSVDDIAAYETRALPADEDSLAQFAENPPDIVVFSSGSAVDAFLARSSLAPEHIRAVCIGETTAETARAHGIRCAAVSPHPGPDALVQTICEVKENGFV